MKMIDFGIAINGEPSPFLTKLVGLVLVVGIITTCALAVFGAAVAISWMLS